MISAHSPTGVTTTIREPTWAGLLKVMSAVAESENSTTKTKNRLPTSEVMVMNAVPEAAYLEGEAIIKKVGSGADFPVGYVFRTRGREFYNSLITYASDEFKKIFKQPASEQPAQQPSKGEELRMPGQQSA